MLMQPQPKRKNKQKLKNVKKSAYIQYQLKIRGMSTKTIADDLGITPQAVWMAIGDLTTVSRVDEWLKDNLGLEV